MLSVIDKRVYPAETGFVRDLYQARGSPDDIAQRLESFFFAPVDSLAASALRLLEAKGGSSRDWTTRLRSGWSRFLYSLLLRCPEDLDAFRRHWPLELADVDPGWEERYATMRGEGLPPTLADLIEQMAPDEVERSGLVTLASVIDSKNVGTVINNMQWRVLSTVGASNSLLTSDRPVIRTSGLTNRGDHIAMPISPTTLFLASQDTQMLDQIETISLSELVRISNRHVVRGAATYVYGDNASQLPFVAKHLGREPQHRLMQSVLDRRKHEIRERWLSMAKKASAQ